VCYRTTFTPSCTVLNWVVLAAELSCCTVSAGSRIATDYAVPDHSRMGAR